MTATYWEYSSPVCCIRGCNQPRHALGTRRSRYCDRHYRTMGKSKARNPAFSGGEPMNVVMARLYKIVPPAPIVEYERPIEDAAPLLKHQPMRFAAAVKAADALIARRCAYAVLDAALARAQQRRTLGSERAS